MSHQLTQQLIKLNGNPYRADGNIKANSTLSREISKLEKSQIGGCGCSAPQMETPFQINPTTLSNSLQSGGDYAFLPQEARDKATDWRLEVKKVRNEQGTSYKKALTIASEKRKEKDSDYRTTHEKYVDSLDFIRKDQNASYSPYGSKNKRPLSLAAAQKILLEYYRKRANNYKNPLSAMKKNIASCHKDPKKTLHPCPKGITTRKQALKEAPQCADSWKYRPGKLTKGPTGPGYYDMDGLDNLCGPENAEARKNSKLYNMKTIYRKKKTIGLNEDTIISPITGRKIKVGSETYKKLVTQGYIK